MLRIWIVLSMAAVLQAESTIEEIRWDDSPTALAGRFVQVRLTDGHKIGGVWISVTPATFTIRTDKGGTQTHPRSLIQDVHARKRRIRGRVIGVAAGFYSIAAIAGAATRNSDALQGAWGLAAFAGGAAGYFVGRAYDHSSTRIVFRE